MTKKYHLLLLLPILSAAGCVTGKTVSTPVSFPPAGKVHRSRDMPSELLAIQVRVDGQKITDFDAEVYSESYQANTGWHAADRNGEVRINYAQSDKPVVIAVRSKNPSQTFIATSHTVPAGTLPVTPFPFCIHTAPK